MIERGREKYRAGRKAIAGCLLEAYSYYIQALPSQQKLLLSEITTFTVPLPDFLDQIKSKAVLANFSPSKPMVLLYPSLPIQ
jgi:hypothetical protein